MSVHYYCEGCERDMGSGPEGRKPKYCDICAAEQRGAKQERARIVADLKERAAWIRMRFGYDAMASDTARELEYRADRYERGEHVKEK